MKKKFTVLITVVLFLFAGLASVKAQTTTIGTADVSECGIVQVPILVSGFGNVGAISLKLNYDPSLLNYEGVDPNPATVGGYLFSDGTSGVFSFAYAGNGFDLPNGATLLTLSFSLPSTAEADEVSALEWDTSLPENCEYSGPNGSKVYGSSFTNGSITIPERPVKNIDTGREYCKIEDAVYDTETVDGHTITVGNGTYILNSTLNINKELTILGESEAGVVIDLTSVSGYGFNIQANNIVLENFTVLPNSTTGTYTLKTNPNGTPFDNLTYKNITINGSKKTPFDIHGYNNVSLTNLTATNTISGVGIAFSGCDGVTMSGITTSNNAWGGIAVYVSTYVGRGSSNVEFDFDQNSIGEFFYIEDESGLSNSNITVSNWTFGINNEYSATSNFTAYINKTKTDAFIFGIGLNAKFSNKLSYVWDPYITTHHVAPGLSIQRAIDMASDNYTVSVIEGTYLEDLIINKTIDLIGPNSLISPNSGARVGEAILSPQGSEPAILVNQNSIDVTFNGFIIDMADAAEDDNARFVTMKSKSDVKLSFNCNSFLNGKSCVSGNWYLTGNNNLEFSLFNNYFTGGDVSNGISIWSAAHTASIKNNVWEDNKAWALNLNQVSGIIENNIFIDNDPNLPDNEWYNNQDGIIIAAANNDIQIINNTFVNNYSSINIYENSTGTIGIFDNNFTNNISYAIKLRPLNNPGSLNFAANNNSITGTAASGFAVINQTDPSLGFVADATCNWYGTDDYNLIFPKITGNVNFVPYNTSSGNCDGIVPPVHNVTQNLYYYSIQEAIDATSTIDGDVIEVSDGTYNESPKLTKSLTIESVNGRNSTTIVLQPNGGTYLGSLEISAPIVVIEGFTILGYDGGTGLASSNIVITNTASDVEILNNKLEIGSVGSGSNGDDGIGIVTYYNLTTDIDLLVNNNQFEPLNTNGYRAFYINPGVDKFTFTNNTITGDFTGTAITQAKEGLVSDNIVNGTGTSAGIGTWGFPDETIYGHTTFSGNTLSSVIKGIAIYNSNNVTITNNTISNNSNGVWIGKSGETANFDPQTILINNNEISGNTIFGVNNTLLTPVDATHNWWGDATGPYNDPINVCGLGNEVTANVDFINWWTDAGMTTESILLPPAEVGSASTTSEDVCFDENFRPTLPVVYDYCGEMTAPEPDITDVDLECNGSRTFVYTYTDPLGQSLVWTYIYDIVRGEAAPTVVNGPISQDGGTKTCLALATPPTNLPEVRDVCNKLLTPIDDDPEPTGTYFDNDCEGTVIYTYTYKDACNGEEFEWDYEYTIDLGTNDLVNTTPEVSMEGGTLSCYSPELTPAPIEIPVFKDVCDNAVTPTGPELGGSYFDNDPGCTGDVTYTYYYKGCGANAITSSWTYTYYIDHAGVIVAVADGESTVKCVSDAVRPLVGELPVIKDVCENILQPLDNEPEGVFLASQENDCEGTMTYSYDYIDCAGKQFTWKYIYTIDREDQGPIITSPAATSGGTVQCIASATWPQNLPVIEDVCGEVLEPETEEPVGVFVPVEEGSCNGTYAYTYDYEDCAGEQLQWTYSYEIKNEETPSIVNGVANNQLIPVQCHSQVEIPTNLPEVEDACGTTVEFKEGDPVIGGTYTANGCVGTVTYTYTYVDCSGNVLEWIYTYEILDTQAPVITSNLETNIVVRMNDGCTATGVEIGQVTATDNCTDVLDISHNYVGGDVFQAGETVVTWTVRDCAGNETVFEQTITVEHNSLSGTIRYNNSENILGSLLEDVELKLTPHSTGEVYSTVTTGDNGAFMFENICADIYTISVVRNGNPIGGINATDAGAVLYWSVAPGSIEFVEFMAGDVSIDLNYINVSDAQKIQKHFVFGSVVADFDRAPWSYWKDNVFHGVNDYTAPSDYDVIVTGGDVSGFDLLAMCTGDFNGSMSSSRLKSNRSMLSIQNDLDVNENQEFVLPIHTVSSMEVGAISLIIDLPSKLVEVIDVEIAGSNVPALWSVNGNELKIGWNSLSPISVNSSAALLKLKLKTSKDFSVGETMELNVTSDPLNEIADGSFEVISDASLYTAKVSNGLIGANKFKLNGDISLSNYPNPFSTTTTLIYALPVEGKVNISVYNQVGQLIETLVDANQKEGQYAIENYGDELASGIYIANIRFTNQNDEMIKTIKFSVRK